MRGIKLTRGGDLAEETHTTRQLYARSRPLRSKFFCPTSFMGGSINFEIHGIQF